MCDACQVDIVHWTELKMRGAQPMHPLCYRRLLREESARLVARSQLLRAQARLLLGTSRQFRQAA